MNKELRKTGVSVIGDVPWGAHYCCFYSTKDDLLDVLIPYFNAGLESHEYCLWVVFEPLTVEEAINSLRKVMPDLNDRIAAGDIDIVSYSEWYLKGKNFDLPDVLNGWNGKLSQALARGYEGMRANGNDGWLSEQDWEGFATYEEELNALAADQPLLLLCTYPQSKVSIVECLDIGHSHQYAVVRQRGQWEAFKMPLIAQARADSERRFRALIENAPDGITVLNPDGSVQYVSPAISRILGYDDDEVLGLDPIEYVHPDDQELIQTRLLKAIKNKEQVFTAQYRMKHKDGSWRWIDSTITNLMDEPSVQGIVFNYRDITDRKEIEEANKLKDKLLRMTGEMAKVGGWEFDAETLEGTWTDEVAHIHDLDPNLPATVELGLSFYLPEHREKIEKAVNEAIEEAKPYDLELEMESAKGHHKWVRTMGIPIIEDGKVVKVQGIFQDITNRKEAEEQLRYQAGLLSDVSEAIMSTDMDFNIKSWNKAAEKIYGWSAKEVIGKNVFEVVPIDSFDEDFEDVYKHIMEEGRWEGEIIQQVKDGSKRSILSSVSLLRDESGSPIGAVTVNRDISERLRLEEEHEKLTAQFYQAQKMESIGRLAGGIAHDFNNLLVPIINNAELSMMELDPENPHHSRLRRIKEAGQRAAELIRQILAFSRQQEQEKKMLNLNLVISQFEPMLHRLMGEDIDLETRLTNNLPYFEADKGQIEQVLMNLVVNARDAMPEGGRLLIETDHVFLSEADAATHAGARPGPYALLVVSDSGHGMSVATQQRIFEPFFTTKRQGEGTGLGLATVFGIVKQHGGNIWVYSEPGHGTTFKIYFPLTDGAVSETEPEDVEANLAGGTETILLVEDETAVRRLVREILKEYGYRVLEAEEPESGIALAAVHDGPIDLLLTDVIMPQMNGRRLYEKLSSDRPDLKVMYMSGYTYNVIDQHNVLREEAGFLQKPFTIEELLEKVRGVLD